MECYQRKFVVSVLFYIKKNKILRPTFTRKWAVALSVTVAIRSDCGQPATTAAVSGSPHHSNCDVTMYHTFDQPLKV
jgi:hypothetical protein